MYDPQRCITELQCVWISKSSAKQRAGRAGRVQNGHYYALYKKQRFEQFRDTDLPEILCSDLQDVCLNVSALTHSYKIPVRAFLDTWIEPPSSDSVQISMAALKDMGALTEEEEITALGRVLSEFPVHPSMGKMILLGLIFRCVDPMIILAASFAMKDMFLKPLGVRREALDVRAKFSGDSNSDQLAVIKAFDQARTYGK
jgi:ATP-dependent RNA helicase DHX36